MADVRSFHGLGKFNDLKNLRPLEKNILENFNF